MKTLRFALILSIGSILMPAYMLAQRGGGGHGGGGGGHAMGGGGGRVSGGFSGGGAVSPSFTPAMRR